MKFHIEFYIVHENVHNPDLSTSKNVMSADLKKFVRIFEKMSDFNF